MPKPFLRWAGGKRQLLPILLPAIQVAASDVRPTERRPSFFEPFLGGGAVFFALKDQDSNWPFAKQGFFLNDINDEVANCYTVVRDDVNKLMRKLHALEEDCSESAYYEVRQSRPKSSTARAARLVYLNRLCFNGLYRLNRNGDFNVPYGHLKNPQVCNSAVLLSCSSALQGTHLRSGDFESFVLEAKKNDVVYFDPPYAPLSETSNFSSYHESRFGKAEHVRLSNVVDRLTSKGVRVILSNSDTSFTRECFSNLNLYKVSVRRSISASTHGRRPVYELLGTNFNISPSVLNCSPDVLRRV